MKSNFRWLCVALITACSNLAWAQGPADNRVEMLLFPPELLIHHAGEIGLGGEQVERIRARLEEAGPKAREHQARLDEAMGQLAESLSAEKVDEEAALKQLEEVAATEMELKRLHFRLMIQFRNELNPEQRRLASKLNRAAPSAEDLGQRLQAKISRIEGEVQRRAQSGQPPFDAVGLMQKFPELMQNGQAREAEALLDRVITMLGLPHADHAPQGPRQPGPLPPQLVAKMQQVQQRAEAMRQNGEDVSEIQALMEKFPPLVQQAKIDEAEQLLDQVLERINESTAPDDESTQFQEKSLAPGESLETVRAQIDALQREDVAWRRIEWKTCLLDGLQASRVQNKPLMVWIFIDRPIDDERC